VLQAASIIDTLNYLLDLKRKAEFLSAVVARVTPTHPGE
jgi:hypothetical protein